MNLDDLDYLLAVADHRSIGRAAESLGLTQPALTRAVARLEAQAGQRLFTRHPRGVEPTPAGALFLARARRISVECGDAITELQHLKAGELGQVRAGYSPSVDESVMVNAARRLLLERPAAQLLLDERLISRLLENLAQGQLDLFVGAVSQPLPPELAAVPLYRSHVHVVADRDHPLAGRGLLHLADLAGQEWLLPTPRAALRREIADAMAGAGLPPLRVRVESESLSAGHFRLLAGTRILGVCSDWWLKVVVPMGLQPLPVSDLMLVREIGVIHRADAYLSPLSTRLIELLQDEAQRRR